MPSQASRQAPGDPGRQKIKVAPAVPAVARLWIVEVPILAWLSRWNAIEKPSIRFSNSGSIASGVTSRPVTGGGEPVGECRAGLVVIERTGVGNRQHRDVERDEVSRRVGRGHHNVP